MKKDEESAYQPRLMEEVLALKADFFLSKATKMKQKALLGGAWPPRDSSASLLSSSVSLEDSATAEARI